MYREFSLFYLNKCIWSFLFEFWYMFPRFTFTIQRLVPPGGEISEPGPHVIHYTMLSSESLFGFIKTYDLTFQ